MRQPDPAQFVLVTDKGFLHPTLFAIWGLLRHLSGTADLHLWGDGLDAADWEAAARVAATNPQVRFQPRDLDPEALVDARVRDPRITAATMGRLFIPRLMAGRVCYLDGDIQVVGDLAPLFALDLGGNPVAGVRDFLISRAFAQGGRRRDRCLEGLRGVVSAKAGASYVNAGVMLFDTSAINAAPDLLAAMTDVARASSYRFADQDHLNNVFEGRIHLLNPAYNTSWRRTGRQRAYARTLGGAPEEVARVADAVVHFHGAKKPWERPRRDVWSQRARAVGRYRREARAFAAAFPDLAFCRG